MTNNTRHRLRRAAGQISLVLIGTSTIVGCGPKPEPEPLQDSYASLEDCKADWGRPEACEAQPALGQYNSNGSNGLGTGGMGHMMFWGPVYSRGYRDAEQNHSQGSRPASGSSLAAWNASGRSSASSTSRGGFGSFGRAFSAGG